MKRTYNIILGVGIILSLASDPGLAGSSDEWREGPGWTLVWADEFDGSSVNTNNWEFELGSGGFGNNELETYTQSNAVVREGNLIITASKDGAGRYSSARLKTLGKQSWRYGKIAARIRLPRGQGVWPAFWMMGDNFVTAG